MNLIEVFNKRTQDLIALMTTNFKLKADKTELAAHTGNKENPHGTKLTHFGVNASATELNHVKGVTSGIQEQLDGKSDSDHTHTVDSSLSSTSTNPVQNKVVKTELDKKATEEALDNHAANKTTNVLHVTSTEKNTWNNKSDFSGNYNDLENAPNILEDGTGTLQIMDSQNNIMMEVDKEGLAVATLTVNGVGDVATALTQHEEAIETNKTNIDLKANKTDLTSHTGNKSNPHGVTLTQLDVTATAAELNKLDGVTATTAELNYVDGVTSNIQTQLNAKQATITGGATTITDSDLTKSRALVSNSSGKVSVSVVTSTEIGYLDGVTSNIQTQLDGKSDDGHTHTVSEISDITASKTELNYVKGVTSAIQTQLDQKAAISHGNHVPTTETANNAKFLRNDNTWQTVTPANIGAAASSHGNHVPATETANNAKFLRNDNTWQTVTPENIGAATTSHGTHVSYSTTDPVMDGTASVGTASTVARSDHKHPTDTSRLAVNLGTDKAGNHLIVNDNGDIEAYEIPTFDLVSIGLPTAMLDEGFERFSSSDEAYKTQLAEIMESLQKGDVKFKVSATLDGNEGASDLYLIAKYPKEETVLEYAYTGVFVSKITLEDGEAEWTTVRWYLSFNTFWGIFVEFVTLPIDHTHKLEDITDLRTLDAMNLTTDQTANGVKTFADGINIGNASLTYDSENKRLVISVS